mmetsp:Transcript_85599/g.151574  ORF Transcript_85599/g.151574 Transcript_85599/m.151574 type:complete len:251 (+) Transcript_85599:227-979(+)
MVFAVGTLRLLRNFAGCTLRRHFFPHDFRNIHLNHLSEMSRDPFPEVHDVPDSAHVSASQLQNGLHEVRESYGARMVCLLSTLVKDDIYEVHERHDIYANLLQGRNGIRMLEQEEKLLSLDQAIAIFVHTTQHTLDNLLQKPNLNLFVLCCCNSGDHFTNHTNQHVHDGEPGKDDEAVKHEKSEQFVSRKQCASEPQNIVQESALEEEGLHGKQNRTEKCRGDFGVCHQLLEGDTKGIQHNNQQKEREAD